MNTKKPKATTAVERYILFIDDNIADYHLLLESLRLIKFDAQIEWIEDGHEALHLLDQIANLPDLIILDLKLPRISGQTILKHLKNDDHMKKTPVIMFSASDRSADIDLAYANHVNGYVVKPDKLDDYVRFAETIRSFWLNLVALPQPRHGQGL